MIWAVAATNVAIFPMAIIANIRSGRLVVSFRHVEPARDLRSDDIKEVTGVIIMKSKREDSKWNGILIFGKRYGGYKSSLPQQGGLDLVIFSTLSCWFRRH